MASMIVSKQSHCKFIRWAITITSAPAATRVYTGLVVLALSVPGSARGKANAWHIAQGKLGGNTSVIPSLWMRLWRNAMSSMYGWGKV